ALRTGGTFQEIVRMTQPDSDNLLHVDIRGQVVAGEDGIAHTVRGISVDVTERMQAMDELRNADRRKDEFLAMLAHELRNPLAPISSAAYLLKMPGVDAQRIRKTSEIIGRQVKHMTSLIDDLLDVSRVTRGLVTLDKVALDLKPIVHSAIEQVRPLIEARQHQLTVQLAADPALVQGDRTRLVQIIANLLNNAAKYTNPGGQLHLQVEVANNEVKVIVSDNGVGIDASLLPHVFELFAQGQRTPDRAQGGLGLGLALVRSLMSLHGGTVEAFSAGAGHGSRFTLHLPLLRASLRASEPVLPQQTAFARSLRLMVVDDNVDATQTLAMLLESMGHTVAVFNDAHSALAQVAAAPPHACILDIGLPDMDGYQLARALHALPQTANATLIALTGYGQQHDRAQSREAGFAHHLVKPVDTRQLVQILAQLHAAPIL
ncbi:MAG: ATP-binding protein, partial [Pseudomonadota bacterium]|nr:ATP-binding protein [Pseudomonadota bacterium]